ncbi:MAG TPA: putative Ig domain-containing protein, partial [Myxococcaceae bacterium]|nr:putative Ig domain-containing protein [Myxococcaceae bacterium]
MSRVRWSWSLAGALSLAVLSACPPPPPPAIAMPADNLGDTTVGVAYTHTITATGGSGALSYSATGLPASLAMSASGTISGTATAAGDFSVTVTATDTAAQTASQAYPLKVYPAPALTATIPATGNVGAAFVGQLTASGGKAPITYSVASGQLPPGVSLSATAGSVTGTPTIAGAYAVTLAATDANGAVATRAVTVDIFSGASPSVVTTSLPNGVVGAAYSATLVAQSGRPPYAWSLGSGSSLPAGLTLAANGQITGTPTASGPTDFQVVVTDANGQTATASLRISVFTALAITTSALPEGYATLAYSSTTLGATGGQAPYSWSVAGALPGGLVFTAATATLSGTPAAGAAGSYGLTFTVTDGSGQTQSASFTLTLYALPAVTTTTLADGAVGGPYSQLLQASGGKAPLTWSVTTGALPAGVLLDPGGSIVGTPTAAGTSTFVLQVSDANGKTGTKLLQITIFNGLTITYGSAPDGYTGTAYNQTLTAAGGRAPYTWSLIAGALPSGVTLGGTTGVLSGTPAAPGTFSFTVQVTDANAVTATKALSIVVYDPPRIVTTTLSDGYTDQSYSATLTGAAGKAPYAWSITSGSPPAGITFTAGVFSGQPTATGAATFTVQISDANGATGTHTFTAGTYAPPAQSSPATLPNAYLTTAYGFTLAATGGKSPFTWTAGGGLPPGITLSPAGALTGTATATGAFTFSTTATDANGRTSSLSHTINVFQPPSITTTSPLPDGYRNLSYSVTLASTGGVAPPTWSITSGALPAGLTLGAASGTIAGTPTASGSFTFTVTLTDQGGATGSAVFTLVIQPPPAITKSSMADGYAGRPYSDLMTATGGRAPYTWTVSSGALPAGVSLSTSGTLSGTPSATGTSSFVVTLTDSNGATATQSLSLVVYAPPSITTTSFADAYAGQAYSAAAAGAGGKLPYTWTVTAGALPAGLTLNAGSGAISGSASGTTQTFTLTLADANGVLASQPFTLSVYNTPVITSPSPLPDGYASSPYTFTFAASGGKAPLTWQQAAGTLPPGLMLSSGGALGNAIGAAGQAVPFNFTVSVTDANGQVASATFQLTTYLPPAITVGSLTTATEGVTYLRAPGTPEQVTASNGKAPLTFSATGLPMGIFLAGTTGVLSGVPAQGTAGAYPVSFTVTDANGKTGSGVASLQVKAAAPLYGGGTVGTAPAGSPITDTLTVFTTDYENRRYPNMGVRIRKNGVEFAPVKEQVTDANGKAVFTGLGLNGTTDTVDVTVNGKDVANESFLKVNSAIVTLPLLDYPVPLPRAYANGEMDPGTGKLIVTGGQNAFWFGAPLVSSLQNGVANDLLRLNDSVAGTWVEDLPPAMASAPSMRVWSGMAYANGVHVLFGGMDTTTSITLAETWTYSTASGSWTQAAANGSVPSARDQMAMAGIGSQVYLFGGEQYAFSAIPLNDMYSYNPATSTWSPVTQGGPVPSARYNSGATSAQNQLWICGGTDGMTELSDCWSFSPATTAWQPRGALSSPRQGLAMAATGAGTVYAFGGVSAGGVTNELMVSAGGTFVPVGAANPPPAREGAVLAYEAATGRLIMFGGVNGSAFAFNDVWTFDPPSSAWTQRTQTWSKAPVGFTLSGNITNGAGGTRSRMTIEASGLSGYTNRQVFNLTSGAGTFTMTGIPAGDTISLTALNEDLSLGLDPNREWSWLDLGVIATNVSGNLSQNVALPTGPMTPQLLTVTGSYALPSGWLGESFAAVVPRMTRPGFANHPNGGQLVNGNKTFRSDFFPLLPGETETLIPESESDTGANCEFSIIWMYNLSPGPLPLFTYPPGP